MSWFHRVLLVLVASTIMATSSLAFQPTRTAEESVRAGVETVLSTLRKYSGNEGSSVREDYLDEVSKLTEPLIGYPVIARRVMGDAYALATRDQKIRFLETFKRSLINTYAGGIYAFGAYEVNVLPSQDDKKDTLRNTRVYLEVVSPEGTKYSLIQSVYYSQNDGDWKMQNAIFNGINLGVTFRTQFEQIYQQANGDLDLTIDEWERITEESYKSTKFRDK